MYPLFLMRPELRLNFVAGRNDFSYLQERERPFLDSQFPSPLMKHRNGKIPGVLSGRRSGLTIIQAPDGSSIPIKLKGCGDYYHRINPRREHAGEPLGGQTLTYAQNDVAATNLVTRLFLEQEGIPNALNPLGLMIYEGVRFENEPCADGVYRVFGDTRVNELSCLLVDTLMTNTRIKKGRFIANVASLFNDIGRYCGSLVHLLYRNDLIWGTRMYEDGDISSNAHAGNFVLMPTTQPNELRVGMVDFDAGSLAEIIKQLDGRGRNPNLYRITDHLTGPEINRLLDQTESMMAAQRFGEIPERDIQLAEYINLWHSIPGFLVVQGKDKQVLTPEQWVKVFYEGFQHGMMRPSFRPVRFDYDQMIEEATRSAISTDVNLSGLEAIIRAHNLSLEQTISNKDKKDKYDGIINYTKRIVESDFDKHNYFYGV